MAIFAPGDNRPERSTRPQSAMVRPFAVRVRGESTTEPPVAWIELLFDALAIVGLVQLATELATDHSPAGIAMVAALAVPIFTGWLATARLLDRYEADDVPVRLGLLAGALANGLMAVQLPFVMHGGGAGFVVGAIGVRLLHLWLLQRAQQVDDTARPWLRVLSQASLGSVACFALSLLFSGTPQWVLWATAIITEIGWPLRHARLERSASTHTSVLAARLARLITLLWAGMLVAVATHSARTAWNLESGIVAVTGFLLCVAGWWLYIDAPTALTAAGMRVHDVRRSTVFGLVHLPLLLSVVAIGASLRVLIMSASTGQGDTTARVLLAASSALLVMALVFVHRELRDGVRHRVERVRFSVAVALMLAAVVAMLSRAEFATFCVCAILLGLAAWETQEHRVIRRHYFAADDPSLRPMLTPPNATPLVVEFAETPSAEQVEWVADANNPHPASG
jgi:low temperature requirement protein LtrA